MSISSISAVRGWSWGIGLILAQAFACNGYGADPALLVAQTKPPADARSKAQADADALEKAARSEGELTVYHAGNAGQRIANAFQTKYGLKVQLLQLGSTLIQQRYAAEADAGTFAADVMITSSSAVRYAEDGIKKGWMEPVSAANIPVLRGGTFPGKFLTTATAIVQIAPWSIGYNLEKVKGADIPKDWPDLLDPRWKGQILFSDPNTADAFLDVYAVILDKYGEGFFQKLRAQNLRMYPTGILGTQALGAGEGSLQIPVVGTQIQVAKDKGAPLGAVIPPNTSGVEQHLLLTAPAKAKHPYAARLFANFIMSEDGNKIYNADPGALSVYDTSNLPKLYESPKPSTIGRKVQILRLLGLEPKT